MRHAIAAAAIVIISTSVRCDDSPLVSADDYKFCTIVSTNAIRGTAMGDTPAYGAMRYEDIAFLTEALLERGTIFDTDFANTVFNSRKNNVVTPKITKRNLPVGALDHYVHAEENKLIDRPRAIEISGRGAIIATNDYVKTRIAYWRTEGFGVTNVLEQAVSNRVDTYTNVWNDGDAIYHTDIVTNLPHFKVYDYRNDWIYLYEKTNVVEWEEIYPLYRQWGSPSYDYKTLEIGMNNTADDVPVYSIRQIANLYSIVRNCRRTRPVEYDASITNVNNATYYIEYSKDAHESRTDTFSSLHMSHWQQNAYEHSQFRDDDGNYTDFIGPTNELTYTIIHQIPNVLTYKFVSNISNLFDLRHENPESYPDTENPRVYKATAFLVIDINKWLTKAAHATSGIEEHPTQSNTSYTNFEARVLYPIDDDEKMVKDVSTNYAGMVTYYLNIENPKELFKLACEAAQIDFPADDEFLPLPPPLEPEWNQTEIMPGSSLPGRAKRRDESSDITLSMSIEKIFVVFDILPNTVLDTWSEYRSK